MNHSLWLISSFLFVSGLCAVVLRKQLLVMLFGLEIMISAALIPLVAQASFFQDSNALAAALIILCVAAAEAVVGLSLILHLKKNKTLPDTDALANLKG